MAASKKTQAAARKSLGQGGLWWLFLGLLLIFLFTNVFLIQFIAVFLLVIIGGSYLYSESAARSIKIIRRDKELREFRFEWLSVEIVIENHSRLPVFLCQIKDAPGNISITKNERLGITLYGRTRRVFVWEGYCGERGVTRLGPAVLRGSDPLGLFPFAVTDGGVTTVHVYPAMVHIQETRHGGLPLGSLLVRNPLFEDTTRRRSLREYQRGDEIRRVNWKATAKTGRLMINEYEASISFPLVIFLNLDALAFPPKKRSMYFERVIEAAAALCLLASSGRQNLGIIFYDPWSAESVSVVPPSASSFVPILERLSEIERSRIPDGAGAISPASALLATGKQLRYGTVFAYVGAPLSGEDAQALITLRSRRLSVECLYIDERDVRGEANLQALRSVRVHQIQESGYEII